jgi:hypothetical protein
MSVPNPPAEPDPSQVATALAASINAIQKPNSQVVDSSGSVSLRCSAGIACSVPRPGRRPVA